MQITVVTPSLPTRAAMLAECAASISAQTYPVAAHLVGLDYARAGTARMKSTLCAAAQTAWVATLEDDDLADPNHIRTLVDYSTDVDVVYSWCRVTGRPGWNPNGKFDADRLRVGNYIPSTALIRSSLIANLGGWRDSASVLHGWDDWDFWLRALDAGARFRCAPHVTWTYRFHDGNKTMLGEDACR